MRLAVIAAIVGLSISGACAQTPLPAINPFNQPWNDANSVIVLDPYSGNSIDWDALGTDHRVVAVIHRATIGLRTDTAYAERRIEAQRRGYLWGAYHLGLAGDPIVQADFFVTTVNDTHDVLMALDLEDVSDPRNMNIADAIRFIERVREKTGRTPAIYANRVVTEALSNDPAFAAAYGGTQLWYARFRKSFPARDLGMWPRYFLWQFSSELNCDAVGQCLYNVPGVGEDMDLDVFPGTREDLAAQWVEMTPDLPAPVPAPDAH